MLKATMFPRKMALFFDILACVFHFMLYTEPEPECIPVPVSVPLRQKVAVPGPVPASTQDLRLS